MTNMDRAKKIVEANLPDQYSVASGAEIVAIASELDAAEDRGRRALLQENAQLREALAAAKLAASNAVPTFEGRTAEQWHGHCRHADAEVLDYAKRINRAIDVLSKASK